MSKATPETLSDLLLAGVVLLAGVILLPFDALARFALVALTTTLVLWPVTVLVWLAHRWARAGDRMFVTLAGVLGIVAAGSALVAILLGR